MIISGTQIVNVRISTTEFLNKLLERGLDKGIWIKDKDDGTTVLVIDHGPHGGSEEVAIDPDRVDRIRALQLLIKFHQEDHIGR